MKIKGVIPRMDWQFDHYSDPPLGLLSVMSSFKVFGSANNLDLDVSLFDMGHEIEIPSADVYAVSSTTLEFPKVLATAEQIKRENKHSVLVAGGPHFDVFPHEYWENEIYFTPFDIISRGEGEANIEKILRSIKNSTKTKRVISQEGGLLKLDTLPFPARELLDKDKYFRPGKTFGNSSITQSSMSGNSSTIMVSRGCPYSCSFCASPTLHKGKVRFKSFEKVQEELEILTLGYEVSQLRWQDDNIPLNLRKQKGLMELLHNLNILSRGSARTDTIYKNPSLLNDLWYAGFREIGFGIESADQNVLNLLDKRTNVQMNREVLTRTKEAGFITRAFIMTGLPGEDCYSAERMIDFFEGLGKSRPDVVTLTSFMPLPGCDIFNNPSRFGVEILTRDWARYDIALKHSQGASWTHKLGSLDFDGMERNREKLKEYLFNQGMSNVPVYNKPYKSPVLN